MGYLIRQGEDWREGVYGRGKEERRQQKYTKQTRRGRRKGKPTDKETGAVVKMSNEKCNTSIQVKY